MQVAWPYYVVATVVPTRQLVLLSRQLPDRARKDKVATWVEPEATVAV